MEGYLGEIKLFGGNFPPKNWAYCHGQLIDIADFQALFAIIGTFYGGDGRSTMGLPDLRSRVPIGTGQSPGHYPYFLGQTGGFDTVIITDQQLPAHTHEVQSTFAGALSNVQAQSIARCNDQASGKGLQKTTDPTDAVWRATSDAAQTIYSKDAPNANMSSAAIETTVSADVAVQGNVIIGQTGESQPLYNVQPFQSLHYIICVDGLFPQRS